MYVKTKIIEIIDKSDFLGSYEDILLPMLDILIDKFIDISKNFAFIHRIQCRLNIRITCY